MNRLEQKRLFKELKRQLAELLAPRPMSIEQRQDAIFHVAAIVLELEHTCKPQREDDLGGASDRFLR